MFRTVRVGRLAFGLLAGGVVGLGGCAGVSPEEYELAVNENTQLRDRIAGLQGSLARAEADKRVLQERRADLEGELSRLRGEVVDARTEAAIRRRSGGSGPDADGLTARGSDRVATVAGDLLFAPGKATIQASGRSELDRIAGVIQERFPNNLIRVEGHTDSDPIRKSAWKTNERLSAERAMAVEAYLVSKGIDGDRMYSAAMGSARPRANKQSSRRVEIVILEAASRGAAQAGG